MGHGGGTFGFGLGFPVSDPGYPISDLTLVFP